MVEATIERAEAFEGPEKPEDWMSPYDDELDVPTFLRRSAD